MVWWPGKNSRDSGSKGNPSAPKGGKTKNTGKHWGGNTGNNPGPQGGPRKPGKK